MRSWESLSRSLERMKGWFSSKNPSGGRQLFSSTHKCIFYSVSARLVMVKVSLNCPDRCDRLRHFCWVAALMANLCWGAQNASDILHLASSTPTQTWLMLVQVPASQKAEEWRIVRIQETSGLELLREEEFLFIELGCLMGFISSYTLLVTLILSLSPPP